ncbi:MAG: DUF2982 domain-containing protein, partial [Shewanella sp.]
MSLAPETHRIRPLSKRNGLTLSWVGGCAFLLGIGVFVVFPQLFALGFVCFSMGGIALILGLAKVFEPHTTLTLDEQGLTYFHRRG